MMVEITCDRARAAWSAGEIGADVRRHVADCDGCRSWTATLSELRTAAPHAVPAAPPGLTDRLAATVPAATAPRWFRRPGPLAGLGAAAAAAIVLATVGLTAGSTPPGRGEPRQVLAAAVDDVRAAGAGEGRGYRFRVEGGMEVHLDLPELDVERPELPDLPDLDAPLPGAGFEGLEGFDPARLCERVPAPARQRCEQQLDDLDVAPPRERFREQLEELRDRLAEDRDDLAATVERLHSELDRVADGAVTSVERLEDLELSFEGSGEGRDDRSEATIDYRISEPVSASGTLEVRRIADRAFVRGDRTGGWLELPGRYEGFVVDDLSAPQDLDALLDRLGDPAGPVEDLGERDLEGTRVRGLAIGRDGVRTEAWVGVDDGRLREITWRHEREGSRVTATARTTIRFVALDVPVTVEEPDDAVPVSQVGPDRLPPFSVSARIDLDGDA